MGRCDADELAEHQPLSVRLMVEVAQVVPVITLKVEALDSGGEKDGMSSSSDACKEEELSLEVLWVV